jgi:hypothetical protein
MKKEIALITARIGDYEEVRKYFNFRLSSSLSLSSNQLISPNKL